MKNIPDPLYAAISAAAKTYGVSPHYMMRVAQIESNSDPNALNPRSSAGGAFQFIDSTAKQYGLNERFDPVESAKAMAHFTQDNRNYLAKHLGREPTERELYLAHQQGASGALRLLTAADAPATHAISNAALTLNGGNDAMSASQFANHAMGLYGAAPVSPQQPANGGEQAQPQQDQQSPFMRALNFAKAGNAKDNNIFRNFAKDDAGRAMMDGSYRIGRFLKGLINRA